MAPKVDQQIYARIIQLKEEYGLTNEVIATRLGISSRTVRVFLRAHRTGTVPYQPDTKIDVQP